MNKSRGLPDWLIQHAARSAPPGLAERLEEEWLADLATRQGTFARLRLAAGCCWATRVIAHEHCAATVAAAAAATGSKTMIAYARHDVSFVSRRTISLLLILCLHVAIIYAFATGLARPLVRVLTTPFTFVPMPEPDVHKPPPPLPVPSISNQPFHIEVAKLPPIDEPPVETVGVSNLTLTPVADPTPPVPPTKTVHRVGGGPGKGFPNTEDYYPARAIRSGEEGAAIVRTCIDEKGRLTSVPTLSQSSGTATLDEGALKLAQAGSGHYRPTTEDGQPVSSCYEFRISFHMKKERP